MRLGVMQPYFFPYLGYFALIRHTDEWVVFDVVKYQPKSWMNRNRILEPNSGEQYVSVPVDRKSGKRLDEVRVSDAGAAREKILRQLAVYRGAAPHYEDVAALVDESFARFGDAGLLRDLNVIGLELVCKRLGLPFAWRNASEAELDFSAVEHAGQWALEICSQLGANSYVNPPGGRDIFRIEEWRERRIDLLFTPEASFAYPVARRFDFHANLSIIDCMMWNEPARIRAELDAMEPLPAA